MRIADGAVVNSFTVELKPGLEDRPQDILTYAISRIAEQLPGGRLSREAIVPAAGAGTIRRSNVHRAAARRQAASTGTLGRNSRLYRLEKTQADRNQRSRTAHEPHPGRPAKKSLHLSVPPRHIGMLRQLEPTGNQSGGFVRRIPRRKTGAQGVPPFQHQDRRWSQRLRLDGRG